MGASQAQRMPRGDWRYEEEGRRFVIPTRPVWVIAGFLSLWLCGWVAGEVSALRQIFSGGPWFGKAFLMFWVTGWTAGGVFALAVLLLCSGLAREVLWRDGPDLCVAWSAFGLSWTRRFDARRMGPLTAPPAPQRRLGPGPGSGLSVAGGGALRPSSAASESGSAWRAGERGPGVSFAYDGKTVSLGEGLDAGQAGRLADQLALRFGLERGGDGSGP